MLAVTPPTEWGWNPLETPAAVTISQNSHLNLTLQLSNRDTLAPEKIQTPAWPLKICFFMAFLESWLLPAVHSPTSVLTYSSSSNTWIYELWKERTLQPHGLWRNSEKGRRDEGMQCQDWELLLEQAIVWRKVAHVCLYFGADFFVRERSGVLVFLKWMLYK